MSKQTNHQKNRNYPPYVLISALFFLVSALAGFYLAEARPDILSQVINSLGRQFQPLAKSSSSLVFLYIFINNSLIDLVAILTFFLFGLVPLYLILSNGFTLGMVVNASVRIAGPVKIAAALIPHGIVEVPSFLISTGIGMWLGIKFLKKLTRNEPFKEHFLHSLKIFFMLVLTLNLIAALIEVYITPLVYSLV